MIIHLDKNPSTFKQQEGKGPPIDRSAACSRDWVATTIKNEEVTCKSCKKIIAGEFFRPRHKRS